MFIAIIGTRFSGKSAIEEYLISVKAFTPVRIIRTNGNGSDSAFEENVEGTPSTQNSSSSFVARRNMIAPAKHDSFLSMSPLLSPAPTTAQNNHLCHPLCFSSATDLLTYITNNWQENYVTVDLNTKELVDLFVRRPFFLLLSVDAPLYERYQRSKNSHHFSIEEFVQEDDDLVFGSRRRYQPKSALHDLRDLVNIHVVNSFSSIGDLFSHIGDLDLLNPQHLRPSWDAYFMTLASLASRRSNCMKRRVGAVLVRDNRVLATGYNGTPRGLGNCNEGGCHRCNGTFFSIDIPSECVCLHAEENALLEAGRERIGPNAVLYCNTCPCLRCTIKIIQSGVKTVVYNLAYKMDIASASLFQQAGLELRRYDPHSSLQLPTINDEANAQLTPPT